MTHIRIGISYLKEHKFKQTFQDSVDPLCTGRNNIEATAHFFLHCSNFTTQRQTLLIKQKSINASIMAENENSVVMTLLFGRPDFTYSNNKEIINAIICLIQSFSQSSESTIFFKINPYYPNFEFFHKNLRFAVFSSVENDFSFKNSKKKVFSI